ncbi:MAG: hypothetical protein LC135_06355 [Phycisphaerae bacterium]|nr:hypothetical protein [Phycisphaerae bacterium]MCZ2399478.1 hypothetical protein [Phycisphaerae bacterium]
MARTGIFRSFRRRDAVLARVPVLLSCAMLLIAGLSPDVHRARAACCCTRMGESAAARTDALVASTDEASCCCRAARASDVRPSSDQPTKGPCTCPGECPAPTCNAKIPALPVTLPRPDIAPSDEEPLWAPSQVVAAEARLAGVFHPPRF